MCDTHTSQNVTQVTRHSVGNPAETDTTGEGSAREKGCRKVRQKQGLTCDDAEDVQVCPILEFYAYRCRKEME